MFDPKTKLEQVIECLKNNDATNVVKKLCENGKISVDEENAVIAMVLPFYAPYWLSELLESCVSQLNDILGVNVEWDISHNVDSMNRDPTKSTYHNVDASPC